MRAAYLKEIFLKESIKERESKIEVRWLTFFIIFKSLSKLAIIEAQLTWFQRFGWLVYTYEF